MKYNSHYVNCIQCMKREKTSVVETIGNTCSGILLLDTLETFKMGNW